MLALGVVVAPAQASSRILGSTGDAPSGIAVDAAGNVYTSNELSDNVTKITPAGVSGGVRPDGCGPECDRVGRYGQCLHREFDCVDRIENYTIRRNDAFVCGNESRAAGDCG